MTEQEKAELLKKSKLIYSGELLAFSVIFLVIGFLKFFSVIPTDILRTTIIAFITILGSTWIIVDFIWTLVSKKRRAKNPLIDKILVLPIAFYMITFDTLVFVNWMDRLEWGVDFYRIGFSVVLFYAAAVFIFQAIYHFFVVHPLILESLNDAIREAEEQERLEQEAKEKAELEAKEQENPEPSKEEPQENPKE